MRKKIINKAGLVGKLASDRLAYGAERVISGLGRGLAYTTEKTVFMLAVPAALLSTANTGNYVERMYGGYADTLKILKGGVEAYVLDEGVRNVAKDLALGIMSYAGRVAENLKDDPETTAYAALATLIAGKTVPYTSGKIRKMLRNRKKRSI